ncbi:hypothetical protein BGZ95_011930 [Linnemannia exigua]|uniref:FAD-binding FR-type domain-containing protein n=1 Tax=Linnemannia exigua TaxID=604196 RepID=A0AAD4H5A4_9FUNG|nr:hypothetical protein BGZ95_011930 [Linnemannia exigua]
MVEKYKVVAAMSALVMIIFWIGDYEWLWTTKKTVVEVYWVGLRDYYFWGYCISPSIFSHFVTIWGHYYRADSIFQRSLSQVSWPSALTLKERVSRNLNKISIWEKKDSYFGYTVKYWLLSLLAFAVNMIWFVQPIVRSASNKKQEDEEDSPLALWAAYIGFGSGYAAMGACGMILLLVLRRSMLHALGFTYADLLPLHRGMGFAVIFWSTLHTIGYMVHIGMDNALAEELNFDGETRGPQNLVGFVALAAMLAMAILSLPQIRRRFFWLFIVSHRYLTIISFAGTLMHYPYFMIWYYVVPSMCLYLADRFIPKIVQAFSVGREVICSFDENSDIVTIVITSRNRMEPLKPYYPGDYISLQLRSLGEIYHPFTIASYWPDDPYSMTLYIRTFGDSKDSWTRQLAEICGQDGKSVVLPMNVDGVFGDRMHDYLCSDEIVIFAAGAAITTFMPLIKSIAARIDAEAASGVPQNTIRMYLICTFRYESELYAYGDFLHQITNDIRFTSWLRTTIHVSRAEKNPRIAIANATGTKTQDLTPPASPTESESIETVAQEYNTVPQLLGDSKRTHIVSGSGKGASDNNQQYRYKERVLSTFLAADSARVSTLHAVRDLLITAALLLIPFATYIGVRYAPIEGAWNGVAQIGAACLVGYILMFIGRHITRREAKAAQLATDDGATSGNTRPYLESVLRAQIMDYDGTIAFKPSRLDVEKYIADLIAEDVGMGQTRALKKTAGKEEIVGKTTTVFVGGPDGFLDSVEKANRKAKWSVDFHRETWSP